MSAHRENARYGSWTVTGDADESIPMQRRRVACVCDCGTQFDVLVRTLVRGLSTRCRACALKRYKKLYSNEDATA